MKSVDLLLYENDEANHGGGVNDFYIQDMGLERLAEFLDLDSETYEIFMHALQNPLKKAGKIKERQNILRDFLAYPGLAQKLKSICAEIKKNKSEPIKISVENDKMSLCHTDIAGELLSMLKHREFSSRALVDLREQLDSKDKYELVFRRMDRIVEYCNEGKIALDIEYGSGFKFKSAEIRHNGAIPPEKPENKTNNPVMALFQKKAKSKKAEEIGSGFYYGDHFIVEGEIGEISNGAATYVMGAARELCRHILAFCASLSSQLSFYIACIEIIAFMERGGIKTAFPEICGGSSGIKAKNLCDFGLLLRENAGENCIVPNGFDDAENAWHLISGANQGGKTTFLKSLGIAQLFAQAGLKVPAESYMCPVFGNFFSHFPKDEDEDLNFGKLAEELMRIKRSMPQIADSALVLFNESFSTTTETEGYEIASDILRALSETKSKILFVTHNYLLLQNRFELGKLLSNGAKIKSLIVAKDKNLPGQAYRIVEGEPQEDIETMDFVDSLKRP